MEKILINPEGLAKPSGYSYAVLARGGSLLFIAGQVGWDAERRFVGNNIEQQFDKALENMRRVVEAAGGSLTDLVKLNIYVIDKRAYFAASEKIGAIYRKYFGKYYPAMTLVEVKSLADDGALLEIEGIAMIAGKDPGRSG